MAIKPFRGQTGADSYVTARLRKLQEASQVPLEPEVVEKTGNPYIDSLMQRRANTSINPKQRDLEIEDYTYIQPDRNLRQQVPPSRMITNPEEMEKRLQAIARNYFPADEQRKSKDERRKSEPYSRGRFDFTPREEVSRDEEQELIAARQQDIRRFKENIDPYLSKENKESLADDLISMRFKDAKINLGGWVIGDDGYADRRTGFSDPNTMTVFGTSEGEYPRIMAHEYRHFTGTENPKEEQVRFEREIYNLLSDTYTAQTREDLKSSIRNLIHYEGKIMGTVYEEEQDNLNKIKKSLSDPNTNLAEKLKDALENLYFANDLNLGVKKDILEKYEPSPFLAELLAAQEDKRLTDTKKY